MSGLKVSQVTDFLIHTSGQSQWSKEACRKHLAAGLYFREANSARPRANMMRHPWWNWLGSTLAYHYKGQLVIHLKQTKHHYYYKDYMCFLAMISASVLFLLWQEYVRVCSEFRLFHTGELRLGTQLDYTTVQTTIMSHLQHTLIL